MGIKQEDLRQLAYISGEAGRLDDDPSAPFRSRKRGFLLLRISPKFVDLPRVVFSKRPLQTCNAPLRSLLCRHQWLAYLGQSLFFEGSIHHAPQPKGLLQIVASPDYSGLDRFGCFCLHWFLLELIDTPTLGYRSFALLPDCGVAAQWLCVAKALDPFLLCSSLQSSVQRQRSAQLPGKRSLLCLHGMRSNPPIYYATCVVPCP